MRGCLRIVDSNGKVLEIWSQWDRLFQGTNGPHKIKISPYDPQHRVWVVGETKNVIYVFSNDGKQLLKTLGVEGVEPKTRRTSASRRTSRSFPTAACSSPTA